MPVKSLKWTEDLKQITTQRIHGIMKFNQWPNRRLKPQEYLLQKIFYVYLTEVIDRFSANVVYYGVNFTNAI